MSIHDIVRKIKGTGEFDHITSINIIVIILVGICAFGLGRLSTQNPKFDDQITITDSSVGNTKSMSASVLGTQIYKNNTDTYSKGEYVASKNGKLYYTVNCSGAKRIKEENKIWFESKAEAEKLGLTFSTSCK